MQMHVNLQAIIISNCVNSVYLTADTAFHNSFTDVFFFFLLLSHLHIYMCIFNIGGRGGFNPGSAFFFLKFKLNENCFKEHTCMFYFSVF